LDLASARSSMACDQESERDENRFFSKTKYVCAGDVEAA